MDVHASDHPLSPTRATGDAKDDTQGPATSPQLQGALELGTLAGTFLDGLTRTVLGAEAHRALRADVAAAAARCSYLGMALWALSSSLGSPQGKRASEAIAGVSLGVLQSGRS